MSPPLPAKLLHAHHSPVRATRVIAGTIVGGLLGGALALAAAASVEPTYRASAQVEFVQAPGTVPLSDAARDARIDGFVETARSLPVADAILADPVVATDPDLAAAARNLGNGGEARAALLDRLRAERIGATALVRLDASAATPLAAAQLASAAADALIRRSLADRFAAVAPPGTSLDQDVDAARAGAERADFKLASYRAGLDFSGPPGSGGDDQLIAALDGSANGARGEAAAAASRAAAAARHVVVSATSIGQNGTASLAELRSQRAELTRRVAQLGERFAPGYPLLESAQAELAVLDHAISAELASLAGSASADAAAARSRSSALAAGLAKAERRRARAVGGEAELARLQRDSDAARDAYRLLEQASLQRSAERSLARSELRLAVPASLPLRPVSPDRPLMTPFGGLALALAGGFAAIWSERRRLGALRFEA